MLNMISFFFLECVRILEGLKWHSFTQIQDLPVETLLSLQGSAQI